MPTSTRAMIGIYNIKDKTVSASYCHYDGYIQGVGRTLNKYYNSQYDAEAVAKGGYIVRLLEDYAETRQHADRDGRRVPCETYESVDQYMKNGRDYYDTDYLYLWDGAAWFFTSCDVPQFEEVEMNLMSNV